MRNLTSYSDQFILGLMEECNINPHKATANVQLSVQNDGSLVEYLNIWQELPSQLGWDEIVQLVFSENKQFVDFCDEMKISAWDARCLVDNYEQVEKAIAEIHDAEYEAYLEDYYSDYDAEIMRDVMWINHNC